MGRRGHWPLPSSDRNSQSDAEVEWNVFSDVKVYPRIDVADRGIGNINGIVGLEPDVLLDVRAIENHLQVDRFATLPALREAAELDDVVDAIAFVRED